MAVMTRWTVVSTVSTAVAMSEKAATTATKTVSKETASRKATHIREYVVDARKVADAKK